MPTLVVALARRNVKTCVTSNHLIGLFRDAIMKWRLLKLENTFAVTRFGVLMHTNTSVMVMEILFHHLGYALVRILIRDQRLIFQKIMQ